MSTTSKSDSVHIRVSSQALSDYRFFNGFIGYDDPVIQTDITTAFSNGLELGIWHSAGLNDDDLSSDFGDEIDYTMGWSGKIKETNVSGGISYFDIFELGTRKKGDGAADVIRPYVAASQSFELSESQKLGPTAKLEGRMRAYGDANLGLTLYLGAQHGWTINPQLSFNQKLRLVDDTGSIGFEKILLGRYDAGFVYDLGKTVSWNVFSVTATTPITSPKNGQKSGATLGTGLIFRF